MRVVRRRRLRPRPPAPRRPDPELPSAFDVDRELAERHLVEFVRQAWHLVVPGDPYVHGWHIDAICQHLEAVYYGTIRRLIINVPPRHTKSNLTSVFFPVWCWIHNPTSRWMFASYAEELSVRDSLACRRLIESDWFKARWGEKLKLAGDSNLKTHFENDKGGSRLATSVRGSVTGHGGDFLVVDDPHNAKDGESEAVRQATTTWFDLSWSNRFTDPARTAMVVIMQRLHEGDVTGHLLAKKAGWEHLCLPAEYDGVRSSLKSGWKDPRTVKGELLWPERMTRAEVEQQKLDLGPYGTAGQLQQDPAPAEGGIFKRAWFERRWEPTDDEGAILWGGQRYLKKYMRMYTTTDLATSEKETADSTASGAWGLWPTKPPILFLLDMEDEQVEGPKIIPQIRRILHSERARTAWIEKKGFQLSLIQNAIAEGVPARELDLPGDKMMKALAATPLCARGLVVLPRQHRLLERLEKQLFKFPNATHDDLVDVLSMATAVIGEMSRGLKDRLRANADAQRKTEPKKSPLTDSAPERSPYDE